MKSDMPNVAIALLLSNIAAQRKFAGFFSYLGAVHRWNLRVLRERNEIAAFFGALAQTSSSITLSIGAMAARLTPAQAAVATDKGYAIS